MQRSRYEMILSEQKERLLVEMNRTGEKMNASISTDRPSCTALDEAAPNEA